jgi:hypothetical protein
MINNLGKLLALVHVGLSLMLMAVALALYFNAVDFGWEQPARYWREAKGRKDDNLLLPSLLDKREAAVRELVRLEREELTRLGQRQESLARIERILADNHLESDKVLEDLETGENTFPIRDVKFDSEGKVVLDPKGHAQYGMPALDTVVAEINRSYKGYQQELEKSERLIADVNNKTQDLQNKLKALTERLTGEVDDKGQPLRDASGSVKEPGWYYLLENEVHTQKSLQQERDYLEPLREKELNDADRVLSQRESLLRRLQELGDTGYLSQSQFLTELLRKSK